VLIVNMPDTIAVAAFAASVAATGMVRPRTTTLLTVDEVDQALGLPAKYRGPGQEK